MAKIPLQEILDNIHGALINSNTKIANEAAARESDIEANAIAIAQNASAIAQNAIAINELTISIANLPIANASTDGLMPKESFQEIADLNARIESIEQGGSGGIVAETDPIYTADKPNLATKQYVIDAIEAGTGTDWTRSEIEEIVSDVIDDEVVPLTSELSDAIENLQAPFQITLESNAITSTTLQTSTLPTSAWIDTLAQQIFAIKNQQMQNLSTEITYLQQSIALLEQHLSSTVYIPVYEWSSWLTPAFSGQNIPAPTFVYFDDSPLASTDDGSVAPSVHAQPTVAGTWKQDPTNHPTGLGSAFGYSYSGFLTGIQSTRIIWHNTNYVNGSICFTDSGLEAADIEMEESGVVLFTYGFGAQTPQNASQGSTPVILPDYYTASIVWTVYDGNGGMPLTSTRHFINTDFGARFTDSIMLPTNFKPVGFKLDWEATKGPTDWANWAMVLLGISVGRA